MANDIATHPRLWDLDTVGAVKAAGTRVFIRSIHFQGTTAADFLTISEYAPDGSTAQEVIRMKVGATGTVAENKDFVPPIELNGLYLTTITHGHAFILIDKLDPQTA